MKDDSFYTKRRVDLVWFKRGQQEEILASDISYTQAKLKRLELMNSSHADGLLIIRAH